MILDQGLNSFNLVLENTKAFVNTSRRSVKSKIKSSTIDNYIQWRKENVSMNSLL